jgi:hypothetical protein
MEARSLQARKMLQEILKAPNLTEAMQANFGAVDDFFVHAINEEREAARKSGDLEKIGKLQQISDLLQEASAPPPEFGLIEELLDAEDDAARRAWLEAHREEISPQFMDTLTSLMAQTQSSEDKELGDRLQKAYRSALRFSMEANLNNAKSA